MQNVPLLTPIQRHAVVSPQTSVPFLNLYRATLFSAFLAIIGCTPPESPKDVTAPSLPQVAETTHTVEQDTEIKMKKIESALENLHSALQGQDMESPFKEQLEAFFFFFHHNKEHNLQRNAYTLERRINASGQVSIDDARYFFYRVIPQKTTGAAALYHYPTHSVEIRPDFNPEVLYSTLIAEHEVYHAMSWFLRRQQNRAQNRFHDEATENRFYADKFLLTEEARAFAFQLETMNVLSNGAIKALFSAGSSPYIFTDSDYQLFATLLGIPVTHPDIQTALALALLYYGNHGTMTDLPEPYLRAVCGLYKDVYARNGWVFNPYTEQPDGTLLPFR